MTTLTLPVVTTTLPVVVTRKPPNAEAVALERLLTQSPTCQPISHARWVCWFRT